MNPNSAQKGLILNYKLSSIPLLKLRWCLIHGGIDSFCILSFGLYYADELVLLCIIFVDVILAIFVAYDDSVVAVWVPRKEPSTRRCFGFTLDFRMTRSRWRERRLAAYKQQPLGVIFVELVQFCASTSDLKSPIYVERPYRAWRRRTTYRLCAAVP